MRALGDVIYGGAFGAGPGLPERLQLDAYAAEPELPRSLDADASGAARAVRIDADDGASEH